MRFADPRREEYERWVASYADELYRFAYRMSGRAEVAEDLVQETFYEAWRSQGSLNDPERARAWLFQILRHRYWHHVRADAHRLKPTAGLEAADQRAQVGAAGLVDRLAAQDALQGALNELHESYRQPFLMVFVEGLTCREAGEKMNIPLGTVLSRIHRARQFLKSRLAGSYGPRPEQERQGVGTELGGR